MIFEVLFSKISVSYHYTTNLFKIFNNVNFLYDIFYIKIFDFSGLKKTELSKKIGLRIIALREKKNWNQSDLARACGKDRQAMEKLENGKVNPTIYSLYEVARALEVSLIELLEI